MKNLLLVFSLIPIISFAEGPDDSVDNATFFRDKQYYEYYLKENTKHLGDALKSITTASKAWDTCPAMEAPSWKWDVIPYTSPFETDLTSYLELPR